eukprot:CAMPEP_0113693480 /NCGR_PEP_ID=MMETSP0038_2-20120614/19687_1 /TAXON_ID=2898 /ORGANISM="Cryptomonas paramecium" /LENGTH=86 /DNA_ID=CAMNT_0000615555 /DNA_START=396 /DNA_END=656 /DNA_ORIENTATION=+ /assembly_acc=CAM_ASM_000170
MLRARATARRSPKTGWEPMFRKVQCDDKAISVGLAAAGGLIILCGSNLHALLHHNKGMLAGVENVFPHPSSLIDVMNAHIPENSSV